MLDNIILDPLTIEELVKQDSSVEDTFHLNKGIWWRKIRPFFYQPAHLLIELEPNVYYPKSLKAFIGYHHIVPKDCFSNAFLCVMAMLNVDDYSLELLSANKRSKIRRGFKKVQVKKIGCIKDLLIDGYKIYSSFYSRARWGRNKTDFRIFKCWIERAFKLPKRIELGAYLDNQLIAFMFGHAVEDTGYLSYIASHSDYLKLYPNEVLVHAFLEICKRSPDVHKVVFGLKSLRESLNKFKRQHGFEEVTYPAYVKLNPIARGIAKNFMKKQYKRLIGY